MTRSRYSKKESLNRIVRTFEGSPLTSDSPDQIPGEVLSEDEALSDLAELFEGSLPSQTFVLPAAWKATVAQANAESGMSNDVALTPASHQWAHEYGGIFVSTGTNSSPFNILAADTWAKVTGTFKGTMEDSGTEIYCHPAQDRIVVNEIGVYFIHYHADLLNMGDATVFKGLIYAGTTQQRATQSYASFGASGTVDGSKALVGGGYVSVTASGTAISLYLNAVAATTYQVAAAQLTVERAVGG